MKEIYNIVSPNNNMSLLSLIMFLIIMYLINYVFIKSSDSMKSISIREPGVKKLEMVNFSLKN